MSAAAIGALRRRLELQAPQRSTDEGGGAIVVWIAVAEVWADIAAISGGERFEADRLSGRISHRITLRYRPDLLPEMRLREGTRIFEIRSVMDMDGRRRRLALLCEESDL